MTSKTFKFHPIAVLAVLLALGACNREAGDTASAAVVPPTPDAQVQMKKPIPAELRIAEVRFGRYVEPETFVVGGIGKKFKPTDQLFAFVRLEGSKDTATVRVRLLDAAGQVIAEQSREVQPKKAKKVNFHVTSGLTGPLPAGTYRAETTLDGHLAMSDELVIE